MSIVRRAAQAAPLATFVSVLLSAALAAVPAVAQAPGAQAPGAAAPGSAAPGSAAPGSAAPEVRAEEAVAAPQDPEGYARVERAGTELRCFPTSYSPVYPEQLAEGAVLVPTGEVRNGFRAVRLPLGVPGYVHGSFAEVGADGTVRSKGARVAFRYRPSSEEAPIALVEEGTEFRLLAVEGAWLRVRYPQQVGWVASDALVVFPAAEAVETVVAAWRSLGERQQQEVVEAVAGLAAERAEAERSERLRAELEELATRFRSEFGKPSADQDVTAIRDATAAVRDAAPAGSQLQADAAALIVEIERQARAIAMLQIVAAEPPAPPPAAETAPAGPADPLGDHATGWLRISGGLFAGPRYTLEKGGQVVFELECRTGRYTLEVFEGLEVAVRGSSSRPDTDSLRVLDVQRIEVLALPRR
jgi:SH3-like domain-containing protein